MRKTLFLEVVTKFPAKQSPLLQCGRGCEQCRITKIITTLGIATGTALGTGPISGIDAGREGNGLHTIGGDQAVQGCQVIASSILNGLGENITTGRRYIRWFLIADSHHLLGFDGGSRFQIKDELGVIRIGDVVLGVGFVEAAGIESELLAKGVGAGEQSSFGRTSAYLTVHLGGPAPCHTIGQGASQAVPTHQAGVGG